LISVLLSAMRCDAMHGERNETQKSQPDIAMSILLKSSKIILCTAVKREGITTVNRRTWAPDVNVHSLDSAVLLKLAIAFVLEPSMEDNSSNDVAGVDQTRALKQPRVGS
jgi:hypothetical protein